jgi:hypothetical protein
LAMSERRSTATMAVLPQLAFRAQQSRRASQCPLS